MQSRRRVRGITVAVSLVGAVLLLASPAAADDAAVIAEVISAIHHGNAYNHEHLSDEPGMTPKDGALQFWSSGGLLQTVPADAPLTKYESFSLAAKHIEVIPLAEGVAVAMYYAEGSFQPAGSAPVGHYLTRVLEVFVKEDGKWKSRAAHWSPITGGSGTSQSTLD